MKRNVLLVGCGKAGNKMINEMMEKDSSYVGLFVNSSYNDMVGLSKFNKENAFLFSSADGSGRDRTIAQKYVTDQIKPLVETILKYPMHDVITIFCSADGGTGSGITPTMIALLKQTIKSKNLDKKINLVAIMPDTGLEDRIAFENSISFWNEISKIRKVYIDDIKLIDNSTRDNNYSAINKDAVNSLHNSLNMNGQHDIGDIDSKDSFKFNTAKGFSIVLTLKDGFNSAKEAVDDAINNCVFALPNSYECDYIAISVKEDSYNVDDIKRCFDTVYKTTFKTYQSKHNTVVLSGCSIPSEVIQNIKIKLDYINDEVKVRREEEDLIIDLNAPVNKKQVKKENNNKPIELSEEDFSDMTAVLEDLFG